jgi:hypothetical protein
MIVSWDIAPCNVADTYRRFRGAYSLQHEGITLMMEAVNTSQLSISTRPENSHLDGCHCENLKSQLYVNCLKPVSLHSYIQKKFLSSSFQKYKQLI